MINQVILKAKSEELNIPFANLLAGVMTEQVLEIITAWDKSAALWLTNRNDIGLASYRNIVRDKLCYVAGDELSFSKISADAKDLKLHIINEAKAKGYEVEVYLEGFGLRIYLSAEDIRGSVAVFIEKNQMKDVFPENDSLQLITENDKSITFKVYPIEQILTMHLVEILGKLELINDMSHYYQAYKILTTQSVNGRKVKDGLANIYEKSGTKIDDKPINLLEYYRTYSYMNKKWKVYLRQIKKSDIALEDIIDCLLVFIRPIWEALENKTMFLGDWMPQLKRFLI